MRSTILLIFVPIKKEKMARVFSISFPYEGKPCVVLVSFDPEGYDMSFLVRYLDHDIREIIPEGKIVVSLSEGIKSPRILDSIAEDLVYHTTEAISSYLRQRELIH
jgi:hypothetical protein